MESSACSDTGPILHLNEINSISFLQVFEHISISQLIQEELLKYKIIKFPGNIKIEKINKDQTALIAEKYSIDIGESSAIWLCKSLKIPLLLTDDLSAREVAIDLGIKPIGTIGIITRNFRDGKIGQQEAISTLQKINKESSLFITSELINYAISEIKKYDRDRN